HPACSAPVRRFPIAPYRLGDTQQVLPPANAPAYKHLVPHRLRFFFSTEPPSTTHLRIASIQPEHLTPALPHSHAQLPFPPSTCSASTSSSPLPRLPALSSLRPTPRPVPPQSPSPSRLLSRTAALHLSRSLQATRTPLLLLRRSRLLPPLRLRLARQSLRQLRSSSRLRLL
ncbi:hypothetical protein BDU57DRAFT_20035, partial [Ampelomyces quisqualis]